MTPDPPFEASVGTVVTLSVTTPVGPIGVVGVLVAADSTTWSVRRRDGSVAEVSLSSITAGRVVPSGRSQRSSPADVQRIAARGWRALETELLGDWLLRAGGGFTGRANSALAIGDPGVGLGAALEAVKDWYAVRGLPPRIQLVDRDAPPGLTTALDDHGWGSSPTVNVMTAELGHVLRAVPATTEFSVHLDPMPDEGWLGCYRQDGGSLPLAAREILVNHPAAVFASVRDGERVLAIARGAVDDRWGGVFAVETRPDQRRRGMGAIVTAAALRWCGQQGARLAYLQVSVDNVGAVSLYERLNFVVHHHYRYREGPGVAT